MKNAPTTKSSESAKDHRHFTAVSNASEAQRLRIIAALRNGPKTSYDLRRLGCYQAPARIIELRRMGYDIVTERITLTDRDGFTHPGCALYSLVSEPTGVQA